MNEQKFKLRKFNPAKVRFSRTDTAGPVTVLLGKRNTGKSFLLKDLLSYNTQLPTGVVISGTEMCNRFFRDFVPRQFIHSEYNTVIIENVFRRQAVTMKQFRNEMQLYNHSNIDPRTFLILDDCLYDDRWVRDKVMRQMFMNGRHYKVTLYITMQYPLGIPPSLRTNVDYAFILREPNVNVRKKIYDSYASIFPTFEFFCKVLDSCTENYECMVIDNTIQSNNLMDCVFWYKASAQPPYRMCAQEHWDKSMAMGDDDGEDMFNPAMFGKKSSGPALRVHKTG